MVISALTSATLLEFYVPVIYKSIANGLATHYESETYEQLYEQLFLVAWFYSGMWLSWRLLEIGIIPLDAGGVNLLEKRCFDVLKKQKYVFFENSFSGSLIKQANRFSRSFEIIIDWFLFQFYQNALGIGFAFYLFYQQQPEFAFYFLIWVAVYLSWNVVFSIWKLKFDQAVSEADSSVGASYSDAINNIFIVKSFVLEQQEQAKVNQSSDRVYQKKKTAWILMFVSFAVQGIMVIAIELFFVHLMIQKWRYSQFEVGEFVLFQSLLLMLIQRLWEFGRNFRNFFTAIADASEMSLIFKHNDPEIDQPLAQARQIKQGEIAIKQLYFTYPGMEYALFQNLNLAIRASEKIALVGESGSGKSSLTKLLFRFIEPDQGTISFDGVDSRKFSLQSLRQQISIIPQQPELFHRSIRDNITLGKAVSEQQLTEVMKQSQVHEFVNQLASGLETRVGERGVKLSGGEKQRIAMARALLEDAPIVMLDEATSALDSLTEKKIQNAVFNLIEHKTAIIVAHRLSTILRMDRIIVMERGKIIEQGNHLELLAAHGRYYEMWKHQSGDILDFDKKS